MKELVDYYDNKYVRSLIQLVPFGIGSAIDIYIKESIENIRQERLITFFNQLEQGKIELTDEIIKSEDFLHNYFKTLNIVSSTRRRKKIEFIGILFNNAIENNEFESEDDEYETRLKILDELSLKEIHILEILRKLEEEKTRPTAEHKNAKLKANQEIWDEFRLVVNKRFGIDNNALDETLIRIERTGCIYIPRVSANDLRPYCAITTKIYSDLIEHLTK